MGPNSQPASALMAALSRVEFWREAWWELKRALEATRSRCYRAEGREMALRKEYDAAKHNGQILYKSAFSLLASYDRGEVLVENAAEFEAIRELLGAIGFRCPSEYRVLIGPVELYTEKDALLRLLAAAEMLDGAVGDIPANCRAMNDIRSELREAAKQFDGWGE
jgi:hypothetical protein